METLRCDFCAFHCMIKPGETGLCGVRENTGSRIETTVWGRVVSMAVDPVEKKPLYHFLPGSQTFSIALFGCNFRCAFCQNASIAHPEYRDDRAGRYMRPEEVVEAWSESGTPSLAFTYSEPTVWQDYLIDVARGVHDRGGRTIMVTNGFFSPEARDRLVDHIDAFNIDLKGGDSFYRDLCRARPQPVIDTIRAMVPRRHVEVTTMYLSARHRREEMEEIAKILEDAGVSVWHISRFFPAFHMRDTAPTGEEELSSLLDHLRERSGIPFIYGGNSRQIENQQTMCPGCGALCIERDAFRTAKNYLHNGLCPHCGESLYGTYR